MKIFALDTSTEAICVAYTDGQKFLFDELLWR